MMFDSILRYYYSQVTIHTAPITRTDASGKYYDNNWMLLQITQIIFLQNIQPSLCHFLLFLCTKAVDHGRFGQNTVSAHS